MVSVYCYGQEKVDSIYHVTNKKVDYSFELKQLKNKQFSLVFDKEITNTFKLLTDTELVFVLIGVKSKTHNVSFHLITDSVVKEIANNLINQYNSRHKENTKKNSNVAEVKDSTLKAVDKKTENLNNINSDKGSTIGRIIVREDTIAIYKYNANDGLKTWVSHGDIDSIDISFENGVIKEIIARIKIGKSSRNFVNRSYIPIRNASDVELLSGKDVNFLKCQISKEELYLIDLSELLYYNRKIVFVSGNYLTNDAVITIVPNKSKITEVNKPALIDNFDLRLYSDINSLSGDNPNGMLQTEARVDFHLNQGKSKNSADKIWKERNSSIKRHQFVLFNKVTPFIQIMRIEKTKAILNIDTAEYRKGDLLDAFKYAHLNFGSDLNLATYRTDSKLFTLNCAGGILRTKVGNDSAEEKSKTISTLYLNPKVNFSFFESDRLDFNFSIGLYSAWAITSLDSTSFSEMKVKAKKYIYSKTPYWAQIEQSINLHPSGNKKNSVFIRATEYMSVRRNYFTIQVGYATDLSTIIK